MSCVKIAAIPGLHMPPRATRPPPALKLPAEIARYMKIELMPYVMKTKVMILFHTSLLLSTQPS